MSMRRTAAGLAAAVALAAVLAPAPALAATKGYTLAQVKTHSKPTNCWSAINGKVYNLTKWISRHPGGRTFIVGICGKDATAAFKGQHGLTGTPAKRLATYRIGTLVKAAAKPTPTPTASTPVVLNLATVARHATPSDCWSIINGKVYNLTTWVGGHPAGPSYIEAICGIDGSAAYTGEHGSSSKKAAMLVPFLVGDVGATLG